MKINEVLVGPVLTEKATQLATSQVYIFQVTKKANKFQIKQAIEKLFSVKVAGVSIVSRVGKSKRTGKKMVVKKLPSRKLAIVKVKEGKIGLFPQS